MISHKLLGLTECVLLGVLSPEMCTPQGWVWAEQQHWGAAKPFPLEQSLSLELGCVLGLPQRYYGKLRLQLAQSTA